MLASLFLLYQTNGKFHQQRPLPIDHPDYKPRSNKYPHLEEKFVEYTLKAYLLQRKKEPVGTAHRKKKDNNLPTLADCGMEGKLPQGLDFNILASIKYHCDKIYELTSKV